MVCAQIQQTCCFCMLGVFRQQLGFRPRDGRSVVAERGREEVVEETLLPAEGVRHLLRPQGQGQGVYHVKKQETYNSDTSHSYYCYVIVKSNNIYRLY